MITLVIMIRNDMITSVIMIMLNSASLLRSEVSNQRGDEARQNAWFAVYKLQASNANPFRFVF